MRSKIFIFGKEAVAIFSSRSAKFFLAHQYPGLLWFQKVLLLFRFAYISAFVECTHTNEEMITIAHALFLLPTSLLGVIVEAGAYKGGSTAKLSLMARLVRRKLAVFDSFQGIPSNNEVHTYAHSWKATRFPRGSFYGSLREVKKNVSRYGVVEVCSFTQGLFKNTLPKFHEKVALLFLDVDLVASTRTCVKYLYPLLEPGGVCFSHDGHLQQVVSLFQDGFFWKREVGGSKPHIVGLGIKKLLYIHKPISR